MALRSGPFEVRVRETAETIAVAKASQANGSASPPVLSFVDPPEVAEQTKVVHLFPKRHSRRRERTEDCYYPPRNYDCANYDTCLSLAAALDWASFRCSGCNGCVNEKLLWRAHHVVRKNSALRKICSLPVLK